MACATFLAKAGFKVTLCESTPSLGGKAKSVRTAEGHPTEHSLRVYSPEYRTLLHLLAQIPFDENRTVLENLVAVRGAYRFKDSVVCRYADPAPIRHPKAMEGSDHSQSRLLQMLLSSILFCIGFSQKGVPFRECVSYVAAHLKWLFRSAEQTQVELSGMSYAEYLSLETRSPAFRHYFSQLPQIVTAARPSADAYSMVRMMSNLLFFTRVRSKELKYLPLNCVMMMNGPTSERMIDPWERYLENLGVTILKNSRVSNLRFESGSVRSMELSTGDTLHCDYAVLALPYLTLKSLSQRTELGRWVPHLNQEHSLSLESASGIQFFLRDRPDPSSFPFRPGVPTAHLESPWAFISVVQGEGFWRDVALPPGTRYVLSATWCNFEKPGLKVTKPAFACSPEEISEEALAQVGLDRRHVIDWRLGPGLMHIAESEYRQTSENLAPHLAYEPVNGTRLLNFTPLLIHLPGAQGASPRIETEVDNLFLAGEATWSPHLTYRIPTMEKSANSGYLAAKTMIARETPAVLDQFELPPVEALPFEFLRRSRENKRDGELNEPRRVAHG
jgi:uncharacterized protein with NAD-binding domain and iron-sulfur cluster